MAVAKRCDICHNYYEDLPDRHFTYEEDGKQYSVNSIRLGNWNPKTKSWDSIVSAYDICDKCGKVMTQTLFELAANAENDDLKTREKSQYQKAEKTKEE